MLTELRIKNFAIIQDLELRLNPGFTVFTGETGAGKSIIIDAVTLLLGGRAESTMLREGADLALVEGVFEVETDSLPEIWAVLEGEQLIDVPGELVLAREIRRQGRNVCRINGRVVSLGMLESIGEWLVDVHGQSEHLSLLRVREHLALLDRFAHTDLTRYDDSYRRMQAVGRQIDELQGAERESARREDLLRYQIAEIEAAAVLPDELPALEIERDRLANAEKLAGLALNGLGALQDASGRDDSTIGHLDKAVGALLGLAEIDPSMREAAERSQGLSDELGRLAAELRDYLDQVRPDPIRLDEAEARLSLIRDLMRKYGDSIPAINRYAAQAIQELQAIEHADERLEHLRVEHGGLLTQLADLATELSVTRSRAAEQLAHAAETHLAELNMEGAQFTVEFGPTGASPEDREMQFGRFGVDRVEFLVAPNVGEGLKPLVKIASGGETSRLMLGLKSVLATADRRPTLIFDEIDQGIGGRIGTVVGRKLGELARDHQVLCVTHLPQLAAHADQHIQVAKHVEGQRTLAQAELLEGDHRLAELAEMLGGESESNRRSAESLLMNAADQLAEAV